MPLHVLSISTHFDLTLLCWFLTLRRIFIVHQLFHSSRYRLFLLHSTDPLTHWHPSSHPFPSCLFKSGHASRTSREAPNVFYSLVVTRHSLVSWETYISPLRRGSSRQAAPSRLCLVQNIFTRRHLKEHVFKEPKQAQWPLTLWFCSSLTLKSSQAAVSTHIEFRPSCSLGGA